MQSLRILTSIIFLFAGTTQASDLKMHKDGKYIPVRVQKYKGLNLTLDCFKSPTPKCEAFTATTEKTTISKSKIPLAGHPAARLCLERNGLNRIVIDKDRKQYDYCLFKDDSMIDSWDLYYSFYPQREIK